MKRTRIGRRRFLGAATAVVAGSCTSSPSSAPTGSSATTSTTELTTTTAQSFEPIPAPPVPITEDPFQLGVASGDPDTVSVVLWTRLIAGDLEAVPVVWELASPDEVGYMRLIATGVVTASAEDGMSLHVLVEGLRPSTEYIYRFRAGDFVSPAGRTRTTSNGDDPVSIGVSSCQLREAGFWQAHSDIAEAGLDLMVWLGDYTYRSNGARTLGEMRALHASYRTDKALQAAHASCPWFVGLDDNDVANDYSASGTDPDLQAAAYQAWWEHQPTRLPKPAGNQMQVYRQIKLGSVAQVVMFDTRQYATGQDLLGDAQRSWSDDALGSEFAYTIFASPVIVSELVPGSPDLVPYGWSAHPGDLAWLNSKFAEVNTPVVISGDLHTGLVTAVTDTDRNPTAAELMAPAISSRFPAEFAETAPLLKFLNEFVEHVDPKQGWLRLDIRPTTLRATYRTTDAQIENDQVTASAKFTISRGAKQAVPQP